MDNWKPERFDDVYERFFTPVFRYLLLRVKHRAEAEDIAQTVFMKAYQANSDVSEWESLTLNYFFTIARNSVIDHWRKKKEVEVEDPDEMFESIPDTETPERGAILAETRKTLFSALDGVTDSEKEVLTLRFVSELSTKEIAELLGKSEVAVRQLQSRGLKSLRSRLKPEDI